MIYNITYQQDSIQEPNHPAVSDQFSEAGGMILNNSEQSLSKVISVGENSSQNAETIEIRPEAKIRVRHKNDVFHVKQYIEPRNDVLLTTNGFADEGLHLPERHLNRINYDWITIILFVGLALFASVRTTWKKYLTSLFQSTVNYPTSFRMFQEKNSSILQGAFQLDLLFYLIFSVFIFQAMQYFRIELPYFHFYAFLFCLAGVIAYFLLKKAIYCLIGIMIEKKNETNEFLFNADNFKRVTGLILLPVVAVIAFYPFSKEKIPVLAGIFVMALLYSLLTIRGFVFLLRKQFSIFYLILYFCTLEILPLVLLYKILVI